MENNGASVRLNCKRSKAGQPPIRMPLQIIDNISHSQVAQECLSQPKGNKRNKNNKVSLKQVKSLDIIAYV